ncbi:uncharacterized protein E0L32_000123 [Thyridium curvatum]|uniref:Rhodopsin domain-containing protein n=1 Tax=Thyridium curvatum TaxID=1093900 RepID=A0A507BET6_9PEZI|nr:uncharacterized protein E0L32_000123 [Thyridium curvatum]TPX15789.1 hypothetical protein E0L32_000123 [Thyridium curvatum]
MSGFAVNTNGFPDRGPAVFAVTTATLVLATVFVAARLVCRIGIVRRVSWDDYFIILAWILAFGLSFTINYGTRKGLGRHDDDIPDQDQGALRKSEYAFSILYNPALMATKTSILIFYLRLSKNTQPVLRLASYLVLGIVNVAGTVLTFMNIFQCSPIRDAWTEGPSNGKCIPLLTEFICSAPVNIVTDLAILALPLPVLTGMRLPPRQKTILIFTFCLGVFVSIVDVVRVYYLQQAITYVPTSSSSDPESRFGDSDEFPWNASLSLMWSAVEVNVGMTCACIPTLKPLILKILPAMLVDPDGTKTSSQTMDRDNAEPSPKQVSSERMLEPIPAFGAGGGMQAPPPARTTLGGNDDQQLTMLDFLTTPDGANPNHHAPGDGPGGLQPTQTTMTSRGSVQENAIYFGFVNLKKPKSMLKTSVSESFKYCTVVTILFFLWGFSYGLLNSLNNVVAAVADMTEAQTLGLTSVYFGGGYLFGPLLVGEWILRHDEHQRTKRKSSLTRNNDEPIGGFKATFMIGLCFYGTGTIMFWPSAVLRSFPGFLISNFVVGFGLGILETGANPFLALCGPMAYAEMRLCFAQGVQAVASVLSGLIAQNVYFATIEKNKVSSMSLIDVQWTYLAITLFCAGLALFFYYMPLPEVSDSELDDATNRLPVDTRKRTIGGFRLKTVCLVLAVLAQWFYVGAQESMSIFFSSLIKSFLPNPVTSSNDNDESKPVPGLTLTVPNYLLIAHTAFAVSRFTAGYLAYLSVKNPKCRLIPSPRTVLAFCAIFSVIFAILIASIKPTNPNLIVIPVVLYFTAEGPLYPLIFALGLRGQGKRTKRAAAWLTIGTSGPAFWPFVLWAIMRNGGSVQTAFIVVVALLCVTCVYPLYLTFVPDARTMSDPNESPDLRRIARAEAGSKAPSLDEAVRDRRRRGGRGSIFGRLAGGWKKPRGSNASSSVPMVEHKEGAAQEVSGGGGGSRGVDRRDTVPEIPESELL